MGETPNRNFPARSARLEAGLSTQASVGVMGLCYVGLYRVYIG